MHSFTYTLVFKHVSTSNTYLTVKTEHAQYGQKYNIECVSVSAKCEVNIKPESIPGVTDTRLIKLVSPDASLAGHQLCSIRTESGALIRI